MELVGTKSFGSVGSESVDLGFGESGKSVGVGLED